MLDFKERFDSKFLGNHGQIVASEKRCISESDCDLGRGSELYSSDGYDSSDSVSIDHGIDANLLSGTMTSPTNSNHKTESGCRHYPTHSPPNEHQYAYTPACKANLGRLASSGIPDGPSKSGCTTDLVYNQLQLENQRLKRALSRTIIRLQDSQARELRLQAVVATLQDQFHQLVSQWERTPKFERLEQIRPSSASKRTQQLESEFGSPPSHWAQTRSVQQQPVDEQHTALGSRQSTRDSRAAKSHLLLGSNSRLMNVDDHKYIHNKSPNASEPQVSELLSRAQVRLETARQLKTRLDQELQERQPDNAVSKKSDSALQPGLASGNKSSHSKPPTSRTTKMSPNSRDQTIAPSSTGHNSEP